MAQSTDRPRLAYSEAGHRWPLVLIHGFPFDRGMWEPQLAALGDERWIIAPDLAGCGDSPFAGPESLAEHADDVAALLDRLGIARAVVCGLSMGGYIAMAFAERHASRLAGLILACTKGAADSEEARAGRETTAQRVEREGVGFLPDALGPKWFRPDSRPEVVEGVRQMVLRQPPAAIAGLLRAMADRPDRLADLARVEVPALVLAGREDVLMTMDDANALVAALGEAELVVLPGAGHIGNLEAPGAFNSAVRRYLARIDPITSPVATA